MQQFKKIAAKLLNILNYLKRLLMVFCFFFCLNVKLRVKYLFSEILI